MRMEMQIVAYLREDLPPCHAFQARIAGKLLAWRLVEEVTENTVLEEVRVV